MGIVKGRGVIHTHPKWRCTCTEISCMEYRAFMPHEELVALAEDYAEHGIRPPARPGTAPGKLLIQNIEIVRWGISAVDVE